MDASQSTSYLGYVDLLLNIFEPLLSYKHRRGAISCHLYNWTRPDVRFSALILKPLPSSLLHLRLHAHPKRQQRWRQLLLEKLYLGFHKKARTRNPNRGFSTFRSRPVIPQLPFRTTTALIAKQWHLSPNGSTQSYITSKWSPRTQASPKRQSFFSSWDTSLSSIRCCVGWELVQSLVNPHHTQEKWSFSYNCHPQQTAATIETPSASRTGTSSSHEGRAP